MKSSKVKGATHYESKVMPKFENGGAVTPVAKGRASSGVRDTSIPRAADGDPDYWAMQQAEKKFQDGITRKIGDGTRR